MIKRFWREPLVHFLAVGCLLFVGYELIVSPEPVLDDKVIEVTDERLLFYIQHRYRQSPGAARTWIETWPEEDRRKIVDAYVLEEALYREAKALKLDQDDYAGRRRLVAQLEYLNRAFIEDAIDLSDAELAEHYEANAERYREPASITFAHVYFSSEKHGPRRARELAGVEAERLNGAAAGFNDANAVGDRFLYHRYYANRELEEVQSHFGQSMADALRDLPADTARWAGPLESDHGFHAVMVARQWPERQLPFAEVVERVRADAVAARVQEEANRINEEVLAAYRVENRLGSASP
jgi:hypothetical protein